MKKIIILFFLIVFLFTSVNSEVNFMGLVQNWFSISSQENGDTSDSIYGFSNKRIRFAPYGTLGKNVRWGVQFYNDNFVSTGVLDAYIEYFVSREVILKFGKFAPPGTVAGALTSSATLDLMERAPVIIHWNTFSGLHGGRAFGAQLSGKILQGKLYYAVMLANALTKDHNWIPSTKIETEPSTNEHNGMGFWGRLEAYPVSGLSVGGFYGSSTEEDIDKVELSRSSYGAHMFYVKNKFNLKIEYIAGETAEVKYSGMYLTVGYRINRIEPVLGYSYYTPFEDSETYSNITVGVNYFYNKSIKFQFNYVNKAEEIIPIENNIFYVNIQYSFDSKKK